MAVMEVTSESSGLLDNRNGYLTDNRSTYAIYALINEKVKDTQRLFSEITSFLLGIANPLTLSSEDFWPVPSNLVFVFRIKPKDHQCPRLSTY